jgi:beta-glucanase (GH16 family)
MPMTRPRTRRCVLGFAALALAAGPSLLAAAAHGATVPVGSTVSVSRRVPVRGNYAVVVTIAAPAATESVSVFVGTRSDLNVAVLAQTPVHLAFDLPLRHKRFTVRTVSSGEPAFFSVNIARQLPQSVPRPQGSGSTGTTKYSGSSGPAGSTGATGATGSIGTTIVSPAVGAYTHLVWSDEFNGPIGTAPSASKWTEDTYGGCGEGTLSTSTQNPANAALDGRGHLSITAEGGPAYDSAQLDSSGHFSFEYGRLEARIYVPAGSGLCSAFWLLGDSSNPGSCWPQCGEIDVMEAISPFPNLVFATIHGPITGTDNTQQWQAQLGAPVNFTGGFHTYGLVWRPGLLTWTFDGAAYATATPADLPPGAQWVFDGHTFHVMLDLAVGGWPGTPAAGAAFPQTMSVDWIRLYN